MKFKRLLAYHSEPFCNIMRRAQKLAIYASLVWIVFYVGYQQRWLDRFAKKVASSRVEVVSQVLASSGKRDLTAFRATHEKILNKHLPLKIVYNDMSLTGYANMIYSFMSTILIGILTDRAVILNNWPDMTPNIREPLPDAFRVFNESDEFNINFKRDEVHTFENDRLLFFQANKSLTMLLNYTINDNHTRIRFNQFSPSFFGMSANPKYHQKLYETGLVAKSTLDNALAVVNDERATNASKLDALLTIGYEVGSNLLNTFWIPYPNITRIVDDHVDKLFKGYY